MITGFVPERREAVIRLRVYGPAGQNEEIEAIIDTGFDGSLSLPSSIVAQLGLIWRQRGLALLADGSESVFDIYEATLDGTGRSGVFQWTRLKPFRSLECLCLKAMS
jgi:predicted aspartyl protease